MGARSREKPTPQERRSRPRSTRPDLQPVLKWCTFRLRKLVHFSTALDRACGQRAGRQSRNCTASTKNADGRGWDRTSDPSRVKTLLGGTSENETASTRGVAAGSPGAIPPDTEPYLPMTCQPSGCGEGEHDARLYDTLATSAN